MALRPSRLLLLRRFRPEVVRRFCDGEVEESEGKICRKGLIVGVYYNPETKEHKFTPAGQTINNRTGGKLDELLKGGKPLSQGRSSVFQYLDENFHHVVVVGLGREDACYNQVENLDEFRENIRVAAANGITRLQSKGVTEAFVESLGNAEAAAEGSVLTVYEYQELKSKETRRNIPRVHLYQNDDIAGWKRGVIKAEAQNLARRLCETPANLMTPAIFAQNAVEALCPCGVSVEVRDRDWAESKRMTAFMAVAKGSCEPPVILELGYCGGNQEQKPITFVGKGSTFDAGGLCLRKFLGMEEFRADMAGAAVVVSVMRAAASLSLPLNLQAVIPLCENMPSGMALKPGDVVQGMNGKSIRIDATDNEGRLMLADALNYAYHTFKPYILMDIGTLTEGTLHALADAATAVYTNSEEIWKGMSQAGAITGDRVWRMPLWKHFTGKIANIGSADMTNKGNGPGGGACRAAAFMKEMVPCGHWMHLDISNTGMKAHNADFPYLRVGRMTGRPTRTLIQFLYQLSCADFKDKPPVK